MARHIAYLMLDRPAMIDARTLIDAMRSRYPDEAIELEEDSEEASEAHLVRCGDRVVAVMNVGVPLPRDPQHEIWVRAKRSWEEAPLVEANHGSHVIVGIMGETDDSLREARIVSAVVEGLLDTMPGCLGVMWGDQVARPTEMWRLHSGAAFAPYPDYPVLMWIDVTAERIGNEVEAFTVGLSSFIDREIEFAVGRRDVTEALGTVAGLAAYLVEHGNVVNDRDTVGGSETERIIVRHALSRRVKGMLVLRLVAEESGSSREQ